MTAFRRLFAVLALLLAAAPAVALDRSTATVRGADGREHSFRVEVARTAEERAIGLMYRRHLDGDAGMLFDFQRDGPVSMWMKNTLIPLDMLFIAGDGRIVHIAQRTVPHSLEPISPGRPVRAVLELNGGTASRLGIAVGDRVVHSIFKE